MTVIHNSEVLNVRSVNPFKVMNGKFKRGLESIKKCGAFDSQGHLKQISLHRTTAIKALQELELLSCSLKLL